MANTELWEFKGSNWTLPILVDFYEEASFVRLPEMPFLRCQRETLINVLSQLRTSGTDEEFVIPTQFLVENAVKSEYGDPEAVVVWKRETEIAKNLPTEEGVDEFIADWLLNSGFAISKASATVICVSLYTHMLHWLVNRRRPVNLIFGTIEPFQYRKNWKEILLGKSWMEATKVEVNGITYHNLQKDLSPTAFAQSEMLAYKKDICRWTLEFTPSFWFHKHSNEVEFNRRKRMGVAAYLVSVSRTIMSHLERAQATYGKYLNEISAKVVALPEFNVDDGGYFTTIKKQATGKVRRPFRAFVLPADIASAVTASESQDADGEDAALP